MTKEKLQMIAKTLQIELDEGQGTAELIAHADRNIPGLGALLHAWKNASEAKEGISMDAELRHKVPDVWKFHKNNADLTYTQCTKELKNFLSEAGIVLELD